MKGYLKISLAIQGPGDSSVKLTDTPIGTLEDSTNQEVMMPSSLRKDFKQLNITFVKGQYFSKMDGGSGWCDPYITTTFHKAKYTTPVFKYDSKKQEVDFNYVF